MVNREERWYTKDCEDYSVISFIVIKKEPVKNDELNKKIKELEMILMSK